MSARFSGFQPHYKVENIEEDLLPIFMHIIHLHIQKKIIETDKNPHGQNRTSKI